MKEVRSTDIKEYPLFSRGKVRDVYDLDDRLLIVATDRVSAFDVVMPNGIPGRGVLLTKISVFWFDYLKDVIGSHLITADVDEFPDDLKKHRDTLAGRSMLVKKADRVHVEGIQRFPRQGANSIARHRVSRKSERIGSTAAAGFHALDQGRGRPRYKYLL